MPRCYLLAVTSGSSLDQHSNNITLFNLVEQINVPPGTPPPPGGLVPLEIHAYWEMAAKELNERFEVRFALVGDSGLETYSEIFNHRSVTVRFRTRTMGMPYPPVMGGYKLRVDWRMEGTGEWKREPSAWPISITEVSPKPVVTH